MRTVILAAGKSSRFKEAGWPKHKMLLPAPNHKTILEMLIYRLDPEWLEVVALKQHRNQLMPTLFRVAKQMNFKLDMHWISTNRKGPLDTMWETRKFFKPGPMLISYCDIMPEVDMVKAYVQTAFDLKWTAAVVGVDNPDPRFSIVPGTNLGDGGLYYFKSTKEFFKIARKERKGPEDGIPRVVYAHDEWRCYNSNHIQDLGVPADYKLWAAENGMTTEDFNF